MKVYGVMDWLGNFTDVSTNEKTAKRHATIKGYPIVGYRSTINNMAYPLFKKDTSGKWIKASAVDLAL